MSTHDQSQHLPPYQTFVDQIEILNLPYSGSELHGMMCGYLASGAARDGVVWLSTLFPSLIDESYKPATLAIYQLYAITQKQLKGLGFEFQLFLVDEQDSLERRAHSFSDWCEGFNQGLSMVGIDYNAIEDDDTQEALQHIAEFADLDYESLQISEEDEHALTEVTEYTRMAVLHVHSELRKKSGHSDHETMH